jgi:hypothetical protein
LFEAKGPIHETRSLSLSLLVLFAAPVEAQAPKRKAAAVDPMRFDLVCRVATVRNTGSLQGDRNEIASGSQIRLRVDRNNGQSCNDSCERVMRIVSTNENEIVLQNDMVDAGPMEMQVRQSLKRRSGNYVAETNYFRPGQNIPFAGSTITATCTRAPFSGFPATRF